MTQRKIRLPPIGDERLRQFLSRLPFEGVIDAMVHRVERVVTEGRIAALYNRAISIVPEIEPIEVPTPFGVVTTPHIGLPPLASLSLDERRKEALRLSAGETLAQVFGLIPGIGDFIADVVEDHYGARIRDVLTPTEYELYLREDKVAPSILAMIRTLMKTSTGH